MRMQSIDVATPLELQGAPSDILEGYVRRTCLAVAGSSSVARRLNLSSETLVAAFAEAFEPSINQRQDSDAEQPGANLQLVFRHDCLSQGCLDIGCRLCSQNPQRRCLGNFADKYLAGDILKAKCGASIRVEVIDRATGQIAPPEAVGDVYLEMCVLDGKQFCSLEEGGRQHCDEEVETCVMAFNQQNKPLLAPGRAGVNNEAGKVELQMERCKAFLPDLTITGSSEALLSGQKPPFRLFIRAICANGSRATHIRFAVSEAFVVATPRVRTAVKAGIPHVDDPISKLHSLGVMTQGKLADIASAAAASGIYDLVPPLNSVSTVGQFRELVQWAEQDRAVCETVKKVLKLTKGWDVARDHAAKAVSTDTRARAWSADGRTGLLFKCALGTIDLDAPIALLQRREGVGCLEATVVGGAMSVAQREWVRRGQREALHAWWQAGHPGWRLWDGMDGDAFLRGVQAQSSSGMVQLPEDLMPEPPQGFAGRSLGSSGFPSVDTLPSNDLFANTPTLVPGMQQPQLHLSPAPPRDSAGSGAGPSRLWQQSFAAGLQPDPLRPPGGPPPHHAATRSSARQQQAAQQEGTPPEMTAGFSLMAAARNPALFAHQQPGAGSPGAFAFAAPPADPRGDGGASPQMPGIPNDPRGADGAAPLGHMGSARGSDLLAPSSSPWMTGGAEPFLRRDPPASPFAQTSLQNSDNSGSSAPAMPAISSPAPQMKQQHELSHKGSEADGHRRKRQAISKAEIQQRLSTFYGRPLDEADMSKILPEFAQGEFSLNADDLLELMDSQPAGQQQHSPSPRTAGAQADGMLTSPVPSGLALADGVSRPAGLDELPEEEQALLALLAADGGASRLGQRDSALLRIFLDERLDSPRMPDPPAGATPGGRHAGNAGAHPAGNGPAGGPADAFLQPGTSYGQLLHSRGSGLGGARPSIGLDSLQRLGEAMQGQPDYGGGT